MMVTPETVKQIPGDVMAAARNAVDAWRRGNTPSTVDMVARAIMRDRASRATPHSDTAEGEPFQQRVAPWMQACFGPGISADRLERSDRFIEEALELVQASDYPKDRALALVEYVYGRDQGEINQEVGGVMVTLAAHCLAHGVDMHAAGETELARIWTKIDKIRAKQASKPTGSALPVLSKPAPQAEGVSEAMVEIEAARLFGGGYFAKIVAESTRDYYRDKARRALARPVDKGEGTAE